jgi:ABC-type Na+ efflux pump permease subunit
MRQILIIALREVARLRTRFSGGASPIAVLILIAAMGLSVYALREVTVLGSGLYRVGVSKEVPPIHDNRFEVIFIEDLSRGMQLLEQQAIDVYIQDARVISREDDKSMFAVGALKRYLEKQELSRIASVYDEKLAFPLRIGVNYLDPALPPPQASTQNGENGAEILETTPDEEMMIPSLMTPPAPFTQVILALLYILPVTFISVFYTSSFMDEKINRRLIILMSTPVTAWQIIVGKMLPYAIFATLATALIAYATGANIRLALAIFAPTTMFIFAIYLMVPLFYRTFKDTTFISMLVTTLTTAFLVFPAMFTDVNDLSFMSPLTLAIKMYRDEPFGWREYLFPSLPMAAIFGLSIYAGTRMLNEEFLMGYRPISRKMADAVYLILDRAHPYLSVGLLSLLTIPIVYIAQLVALAISTNLPARLMIGGTLIAAAMVEEVVKSMGIAVLVERKIITSTTRILLLAFLSALGFLIGEKLLLFFSISMVSESALSMALFNTGFLLVPLLAHFLFTACVSLLYAKTRASYPLSIVIATILHTIYNWSLTGGLR